MNNLPPGVSENMIPGNRPEDVHEEEFWDVFYQKLNEAGIGMWFETDDERMDDVQQQAFIIARDLGYVAGYNLGLADAQLEQQMLDEPDYLEGEYDPGNSTMGRDA